MEACATYAPPSAMVAVIEGQSPPHSPGESIVIRGPTSDCSAIVHAASKPVAGS
ncbi:MAG: hypothetical protein HYZ53_01805 [Planctomycetes bacterium]|nr:hypothetical protein [Planctomycetota bacterium]